jgi:hypothetical protein
MTISIKIFVIASILSVIFEIILYFLNNFLTFFKKNNIYTYNYAYELYEHIFLNEKFEEDTMEHYKLVITVGDFSIELSSHDKEWTEKKIKELSIEQLVKIKPKDIESIKIKNESKEKEPIKILNSISEGEYYKKYIKEKKIVSRPDIATFFVYYLSKIKKIERITTAEVKNCFKEIGYPNWNNINVTDALTKAKKKAFLNNVNELWMLTITGEDFVLNVIAE